MKNEQELEIAPGTASQPLFKTPEEQRDFEERFGEQVKQALKDLPKPLWFRPYSR